MFQVAILKDLGLRRTQVATSESDPMWEAPTSLTGPDCRAAVGGEQRRERWLTIGANSTPVDAIGGRISHGWLLLALVASTPTRGVPAVLLPSPSVLLQLSEVPTACAGREEASLYIGGIRGEE